MLLLCGRLTKAWLLEKTDALNRAALVLSLACEGSQAGKRRRTQDPLL